MITRTPKCLEQVPVEVRYPLELLVVALTGSHLVDGPHGVRPVLEGGCSLV